MTQASGVGRKRGNYQMKGNCNKKIAPINMKKKEHQYVIDGALVEEVLKQIPEGIKIIQARINCYKADNMHKIIVRNDLKKLGIAAMREATIRKEIIFVFDSPSKSLIIKNTKEGCKKADFPYEKAYFQYIVLSNGSGTGKFEHCTKEVTPDETDLRKKLRVLGITTGEGKVQGLLQDLGAKKFYCTIKEEPVKFIMCSRE